VFLKKKNERKRRETAKIWSTFQVLTALDRTDRTDRIDLADWRLWTIKGVWVRARLDFGEELINELRPCHAELEKGS
jgi:16S rRNA G1207 methylase RsmC